MTPATPSLHRTTRRRWIAACTLAAATLGLAAPTATAQDAWPSKPIRLIVPFTPAGVADTSARVVAEFLGRRLGQQVVVDNKPGASGNIGMALAKEAPADGYTLVLGFDGTMVINPHVFPKLPFDSLKDFTPIGKIGNATLILVANPNAPIKTSPTSSASPSPRRAGCRSAPPAPAERPHRGRAAEDPHRRQPHPRALQGRWPGIDRRGRRKHSAGLHGGRRRARLRQEWQAESRGSVQRQALVGAAGCADLRRSGRARFRR